MKQIGLLDYYRSVSGFYKNQFIWNALWFQLVWVLAIMGGNSGVFAIAALIILHFSLCDRPLQELKYVAFAAIPGVMVDSMLTHFKVFQFAEDLGRLPIPLWLIGLWVAFCCTLRGSLKFFLGRPWLALSLAALSAPASYYAGMRLQAVEFTYAISFTLSTVSLCWCVLMVWFVFLNRLRG